MTDFVGIVNITPDSFSDGGALATTQAALARMEMLVAQGARVIDVGAESTRPGAAPVSAEEEWARLGEVLPVLIARAEAFRREQIAVSLSLDTRHATTAVKAVELGIDWLNDVTGFLHPEMLAIARGSLVRCVVMHSLTIPADPRQTLEGDAVEEVRRWAVSRLLSLEQAGIALSRIILDPGLGFGKTPSQCWALTQKIEVFQKLGVPLLVGHSRKRFLRPDADASERELETQFVSAYLASLGVEYLRVHDVQGNARAVAVWEQCRG
jgi:dihydropteroate synthase